MEMNPQDDDKPATQGMLKTLATKDDLKNFATKDDLKNVASKDELKAEVRRLEEKMDKYALAKEMRHGFLATHEMIKSMAIGITQLDGKIERLIGNLREEMRAGFREQKAQIDAFIGKMDRFDRESANFPRMADENKKRLDNHEARIVAIETRLPSTGS